MHLSEDILIIDLNENESLLMNLMTGAADIIENNISNKLVKGNFECIDSDILGTLIDRKYVFPSQNEQQEFENQINREIERIELGAAPNFVLVLTYLCNLNCTYCYEHTYEIENSEKLNPFRVIDKQFEFISMIINKVSKRIGKPILNNDIVITLMGGEPLLYSNIQVVQYMLEKIHCAGYSFNVVTNGVDLDKYIDLLATNQVKHVQITLDGPRNIHDRRRVFRNGCGSFDKIISNVGLAIKSGISVYIRSNIDNENLKYLPELADLLIEKFGDNPLLKPYLYLLQDGGCSGDNNVVPESIGIEQIYIMEKAFPDMSVFEKRYHPSSFIDSIFNDTIFQPALRHCSASANQYILDCNGGIYKCWNGIGGKGCRVGKFYPEIDIDDNLVSLWQNRSVLKLEKCRRCRFRYICSTGCPGAKHSIQNVDVEKPACVDYEILIRNIISICINQ